jgi:ABC-type branched-subunit amino acid transport system substrate-binding protein
MTARANARGVSLGAFILFAALAASPQSVWQPSGLAETQLSPAAARGRLIYFSGEDGTGDEITALLGSEELEVPASSFACAGCHGESGEGSSEGGVQPPPINWRALNARSVSPLTRRERAAYDSATLARAIKLGIDTSGAPLHAAMPRYRMTESQLSDLVEFLKILGTDSDADPGVSANVIRVGAALPLSGPFAEAGSSARATLTAYFARVNEQGGVFGRRFEIVFEDSRETHAGSLAATRKLVEERGVFALVGSFEPAGDTETGEFLRRQAAPSIGPLTLSAKSSGLPNPSVFYLLPSARDQARALVIFSKTQAAAGAPPRLALVCADDAHNREAAEGVRSQSRALSLPIVYTHDYKANEFSAMRVAEGLARSGADHVFFYGWPRELNELARALEATKSRVTLLGSALTIGRAAFELPPGIMSRTYMAYPTPLPEQGDFREFITLARQAGAGGQHLAFQALAYAAARTFVEAVKSSGKGLRRAALLRALEQFDKFETGVTPPLSFGANRRIGAVGSYVVGIDVERKRFKPASAWIEAGAGP